MQNQVTIQITNAGKKFGREWIFRKVGMEIKPGEKLVILGLNGSGKSTLLQAMTGYLSLNEGMVSYSSGAKKIADEEQYQLISLASPYLELVEDFTLEEQIKHVAIYKPFLHRLDTTQILELSGLSVHKNKYIKLFSSGMKQRVKLTLAILADAPVLFLDEPTTNLDATVIDWYKNMIATYAMHKSIIVCSNSIKEEYAFCDHVITMEDFKL
ncbi:MAG: transporter related protein [Bacteroidetes bacterium]|nr:transporter related protein [Bacteroidota bacterium]MDF2451028.1 transporter related protein [Bacteroidota bacterium]